MKINVSVIVPVYNVEDYLEECLDSLVNQTMQDYEIILINDGSTDGSGEICEAYSKKYNQIVYLTQQNRGLSAVRNRGVSCARGEYVLFVDSDDYIVPQTCETMYQAACNTGADIVAGDLLGEKQQVEQDPSFRYLPCENKKTPMLEFMQQSFQYRVYDAVTWLRMIRRSFLLNHGISFQEGCMYEDMEHTMQMLTCSDATIVKIRFPFYYYRTERRGSITSTDTVKKGRHYLRSVQKMLQNLETVPEEFRPIGAKIIGLAYYNFPICWVNMEKEGKWELYRDFCDLTTASRYHSDIMENMYPDLAKRVKQFYAHPRILLLKEKTRNVLRKILR